MLFYSSAIDDFENNIRKNFCSTLRFFWNAKGKVKNFKMSKLLLQDEKKTGEIVLTEKLSEDLSHLYLSERYSDVVFIVEGEKIFSAS